MTKILRIPANSQAYLLAKRDSARDKFDVTKFVFGYENAAAFPPAWAYWKMEEESGTRYDATEGEEPYGYTRDLIELNDPIGHSSGKLGNAAHFAETDGILQSLGIYYAPTFILTGGVHWMYTFWWKHHVISSGDDVSIYFDAGGTLGLDGSFGIEEGNDLGLFYFDWYQVGWQNPTVVNSGHIVTPDEWHFICLYWNGTLHLEIDNVLVDSDVGGGGMIYNSTPSWGGLYPYGYMNCDLDDHGWWIGDDADEAIARRAELYNGGAGWSPY